MKKNPYQRFSVIAVVIVMALVVGVGYFIVHRSQAAGADINGDGKVDIADLSILASHYGQSSQTFSTGDLNGDGSVGIADLSMLATAWGSTTPACTGVAMTNGQADIDSHPAGTTYCISGTHNWTLAPKTGDTIMGTGDGVLDGGNTTVYAISPDYNGAVNVTIANLEVRNYIPGDHQSAVNGGGGMILRNLQVHDNGTVGATNVAGGAGASLASTEQVIGGRYYNNRQLGLAGGGGNGAVIDGAEIDHNGFTDDINMITNINCGYEGGGVKWVANNFTVKNSKVHDNACTGLWADIDSQGATMTNNQIYNNDGSGIFFEISLGATITGNDVYGNGFNFYGGDTQPRPARPAGCGGPWGGGIMASSSGNVTITGNNVHDNCRGITGVQQDRNDAGQTTPRLLQNMSVHDNTISGGGKSGVVAENGADLTTRNIIYTNNTLLNGAIFCGVPCAQF